MVGYTSFMPNASSGLLWWTSATLVQLTRIMVATMITCLYPTAVPADTAPRSPIRRLIVKYEKHRGRRQVAGRREQPPGGSCRSLGGYVDCSTIDALRGGLGSRGWRDRNPAPALGDAPATTTWSRHSRRNEPISRSADKR